MSQPCVGLVFGGILIGGARLDLGMRHIVYGTFVADCVPATHSLVHCFKVQHAEWAVISAGFGRVVIGVAQALTFGDFGDRFWFVLFLD